MVYVNLSMAKCLGFPNLRVYETFNHIHGDKYVNDVADLFNEMDTSMSSKWKNRFIEILSVYSIDLQLELEKIETTHSEHKLFKRKTSPVAANQSCKACTELRIAVEDLSLKLAKAEQLIKKLNAENDRLLIEKQNAQNRSYVAEKMLADNKPAIELYDCITRLINKDL